MSSQTMKQLCQRLHNSRQTATQTRHLYNQTIVAAHVTAAAVVVASSTHQPVLSAMNIAEICPSQV